MEGNKEVENRVTRKRQQVKTKKKSIRFKKPDWKLPDFLKFTKKQVIVFVCVGLAIAAIICLTNYDKLGLVFNKHITDEDVVKVDLISSNNKLYESQGEVLVANAEGITSYNKYGKKTWEIEMQGAVDDLITTSGRYIQAINTDKSLIYIYKDKYEVARIKIDGKILWGNINEKGYSVIEYISTGNKTVLAVYDNKGKLKYNVKVSNNIIGDCKLSNDCKYLAYVEVNIQGISAVSDVVLIELKDANSIVEKVHSNEKSLIYDLSFYGKKLVYKLEDKIVLQDVSSKEKKISAIGNESIVNIDIDSNKYAYSIFENGKYLLRNGKIGGKDPKSIEIREIPKYFEYDNGNIFVCYQKDIIVYNSSLSMIKDYSSLGVITEPIVFGNGRNVAFLVSNKLIMFSI